MPPGSPEKKLATPRGASGPRLGGGGPPLSSAARAAGSAASLQAPKPATTASAPKASPHKISLTPEAYNALLERIASLEAQVALAEGSRNKAVAENRSLKGMPVARRVVIGNGSKLVAGKSYADQAKRLAGKDAPPEVRVAIADALKSVRAMPRRREGVAPTGPENVQALYFRVAGQRLGALRKSLVVLGVNTKHVVNMRFFGDVLEVLIWRNKAAEFLAGMEKTGVMPHLADADASKPFAADAPAEVAARIEDRFLASMRRMVNGSANSKANESTVAHAWAAAQIERVELRRRQRLAREKNASKVAASPPAAAGEESGMSVDERPPAPAPTASAGKAPTVAPASVTPASATPAGGAGHVAAPAAVSTPAGPASPQPQGAASPPAGAVVVPPPEPLEPKGEWVQVQRSKGRKGVRDDVSSDTRRSQRVKVPDGRGGCKDISLEMVYLALGEDRLEPETLGRYRAAIEDPANAVAIAAYHAAERQQ